MGCVYPAGIDWFVVIVMVVVVVLPCMDSRQLTNFEWVGEGDSHKLNYGNVL